ncbi:uncharacterized protein LOC133789153 isoform X2 [Humulus lupulus]|uniref:uncharacterized protein LOC133789153 isoform X2 n=1 Tax=Humulus lupulus TaxID=3486 RepID=UPI002B412C4C|nr:uncharacterized protein LOC133789153 isoform X2 [Humulus lupulus]
MPQDLPGFYYDAEKNRYFPCKGPIPGSASASSSKSSTKPITKEIKLSRKNEVRTSKLLQVRELFGNLISLNKGKCNFKEEFRKTRASDPKVWKYFRTEKIGDSALERIHVDVQLSEGQTKTDVLLAGGINGSLSFSDVGNVRQQFDHGLQSVPYCVWPITRGDETKRSGSPEHIWRGSGASLQMSSNISCIKTLRKNSSSTMEDGGSIQHAMISTLGSERHGGSLCIIDLSEPLDFDQSALFIRRRIQEIANFNCTIWTADCGSNENRVVIGTDMGAALVDPETGATSWVLRSKSDVLAQQLVHSGNVVLCGLRNGAVISVDVREKREGSGRLVRHRISQLPLDNSARNSNKRWFKLSGNLHPSHTIQLPSSISSLLSLQYDDQYFLASSMDGSVKLYDHRLCQRGAVQSYEGHVNSHTRIQLGVDPSERFVMSGGEDCYLRLWSIKSGELLFQDKFSNTILSTVSWQRREGYHDEQSSSIGASAWLGSQEGLFLMQWS